MRFGDKIAIVTGGGSGMGKETAARFVAEGGSVVINDAAKAEAAAREIDPPGTRGLRPCGGRLGAGDGRSPGEISA